MVSFISFSFINLFVNLNSYWNIYSNMVGEEKKQNDFNNFNKNTFLWIKVYKQPETKNCCFSMNIDRS